MQSSVKLWIRDELFEHAVLHGSINDAKRVTSHCMREAVSALLHSSASGPTVGCVRLAQSPMCASLLFIYFILSSF
jgi:hypothetical protein